MRCLCYSKKKSLAATQSFSLQTQALPIISIAAVSGHRQADRSSKCHACVDAQCGKTCVFHMFHSGRHCSQKRPQNEDLNYSVGSLLRPTLPWKKMSPMPKTQGKQGPRNAKGSRLPGHPVDAVDPCANQNRACGAVKPAFGFKPHLHSHRKLLHRIHCVPSDKVLEQIVVLEAFHV